jgi:predicted O-linked N-acetylglucosamine transferase (SPINDLY family)
LAHSPADCKRLRTHLKEVRENGVLFDTPRFVKNLESRLQTLSANL